MSHGARIEAFPPDGQCDERPVIRVSGLAAGSRVRLRARAGRWESEASFVSPGTLLDLADVAPVAGGYDFVDSAGLIWSLRRPGDPGVSAPPYDPWILRIDGDVEGQPLEAVQLVRRYRSPRVVREGVRSADGVVGTLFVPEGEGPHPAVFTLSGSNGGVNEAKAALLASHGYAVLALGYFGMPGLPADMIEIPLEYFARARDWLRTRPRVDAERVAVSGASRGGELALLLGATFPWVCGVIAYVPSGVIFGGIAHPLRPVDRAAWSLGGQPLPYLRPRALPRPMSIREIYLHWLENGADVARCAIAVERTCGPILLCSAADDAVWPSRELAAIAQSRLEAHGFRHEHAHICYEGAGHVLGLPHLPRPPRAARAAEDAWRRGLELLRKAFASGSR